MQLTDTNHEDHECAAADCQPFWEDTCHVEPSDHITGRDSEPDGTVRQGLSQHNVQLTGTERIQRGPPGKKRRLLLSHRHGFAVVLRLVEG